MLCGLGQQCLPAGTGTWLPTLRKGRPAWDTVLATLAELYVRGVPLDWTAVDRPYPRRKVSLPTYPFQRERYWVAAAERAAQAAPGETPGTGVTVHPLLGRRLRTARRTASSRTRWEWAPPPTCATMPSMGRRCSPLRATSRWPWQRERRRRVGPR